MRKEVWFAIIGGILLGLIIGFGVYRINFAFKKDSVPNSSPTPAPTAQGLTIAKPTSDDVITSLPLKISGITSKGAWVVISTGGSDYIFKANEKGVFEEDIDLEGGVNQVVVSGIDKNGIISSQELRLIYSTQLESSTPNTETAPSSSESGVRETVLKKVEDVLNNPKAYLGVVTDILDGTVQLKTDSGSIEQVSTKDDAVKVIKQDTASKEVKLTDIAIGDYIVAMGFRNGNHVLNAKRILIITPPTKSDIKVVFGKIKSINKKEIKIEDNTITLSSTTKYTTFAKDGSITSYKSTNLEENDLIISVSKVKEETFTARRIHLVESSE